MKLALDWPGLALDLLGLAQIGQLTNFCFCEKLTSDWHGLVRTDWPGIGTGFVKIGIALKGRLLVTGEFVSNSSSK